MEIATTYGNSRGNETGGNRESTGEDRLSGRSLPHFLPLPQSIYISVYIYICISLEHANVYESNPSARLNPIGNARYSPCRPRTAGRSGL